jgi:hypothetical protein
LQINELLQDGETTPFYLSKTAVFDSDTYIKVFYDTLDFSSIEKNSLLFQTLVSGNKEIGILISALGAMTKNKPFLFKGK